MNNSHIFQRITEEQYEDFFQEMLAQMLPQIKRNNIRPSYVNDVGFASHTDEDTRCVTITDGIDADDTLIYFKVYFDTQYIEAFKHTDGSMYQPRFVTLKVEVYGNKRVQIGLLLRGLIRADYVMNYLNGQCVYLYQEGNINPDVKEFIHGQWYKRYDLEWTFNECLQISVPQQPEIAISTEVTIASETKVTVIKDDVQDE